jgi:hypothetical protein
MTEEFPLPEARRVSFPQGRLSYRLCQVVGEPVVQWPEYYPESLGIEKRKARVLLCPVDPSSVMSGPIV